MQKRIKISKLCRIQHEAIAIYDAFIDEYWQEYARELQN